MPLEQYYWMANWCKKHRLNPHFGWAWEQARLAYNNKL